MNQEFHFICHKSPCLCLCSLSLAETYPLPLRVMDQPLSGRKRLWGYRSLQRLYFTLQIWKKYTHTDTSTYAPTPKRQHGTCNKFQGGADKEEEKWSCLMLKHFYSSWHTSTLLIPSRMCKKNGVSLMLLVAAWWFLIIKYLPWIWQHLCSLWWLLPAMITWCVFTLS